MLQERDYSRDDQYNDLTPAERDRLGAIVQRLAASGVLTEDSMDAKRLAFVLYLRAKGHFTEGIELDGDKES